MRSRPRCLGPAVAGDVWFKIPGHRIPPDKSHYQRHWREHRKIQYRKNDSRVDPSQAMTDQHPYAERMAKSSRPDDSRNSQQAAQEEGPHPHILPAKDPRPYSDHRESSGYDETERTQLPWLRRFRHMPR